MMPSEKTATPPEIKKPAEPDHPPAVADSPHSHKHRRILWGIIIGAVILIAVIFGVPEVLHLLNTVSTDDAYVNGHVTFVAPRVSGQVLRVLVDDNYRVHKGDLLVQLDPEPYQVQLNIAKSAVDSAQASLAVTKAQVRSVEAQTRSNRFKLDHAIEDVQNQIAMLNAKFATVQSNQAELNRAQADYDRAEPLVSSGAVTREELDRRQEVLLVAQAQVQEALQEVYQIRVGLGLPTKPADGGPLTEVPPDLDQTFSSVRTAQADIVQSIASLGVVSSLLDSPQKMISDFYKRDPEGNIDRIYAKLLLDAPTVKQAESRLAEAQRNQDQAELNLRYCNVVSEIDGVVTRRDVNPGNNVVAGQSLMAVRSLTEVWIDANFKETQLADLRIGQPVDVYADMYGSHVTFKGRISGFTNGTGSTLALLPAENATGNFVKVVQRLPVRIDLVDYDPDKIPLFIGLSVEPEVQISEESSGPDAGKVLQPYAILPTTNPDDLPTTQETSP
jgi:membrane fusion protein, multidrug efflux system